MASGGVPAAIGGSAEGQYVRAKTSVWWDIENCPVPRLCDAHMIAQNISSALADMDYIGAVTISAYGDTRLTNSTVQQALSSTGISLNHVPSGVKDASDKKILVDMLFWAVDNPPPANYLLISGDRDFSNALHQLRMRRYNILLAQPPNASQALVAAAKSVWLWTSLLNGGPPLAEMPHFHDASICDRSTVETPSSSVPDSTPPADSNQKSQNNRRRRRSHSGGTKLPIISGRTANRPVQTTSFKKPGAPSNGQESVVCFFCNKPGHHKKDCQLMQGQCLICGMSDHVISDCPKQFCMPASASATIDTGITQQGQPLPFQPCAFSQAQQNLPECQVSTMTVEESEPTDQVIAGRTANRPVQTTPFKKPGVPSNGQELVVCFFCNKPGHHKKDCRLMQGQCLICGTSDHVVSDCPKQICMPASASATIATGITQQGQPLPSQQCAFSQAQQNLPESQVSTVTVEESDPTDQVITGAGCVSAEAVPEENDDSATTFFPQLVTDLVDRAYQFRQGLDYEIRKALSTGEFKTYDQVLAAVQSFESTTRKEQLT